MTEHSVSTGAAEVAAAVRAFQSGPFGYVTAGSDDVIDGVNTTFLRWLGLEREKLVGHRTFQDLLAVGDRIYYDTHLRPLLDLRREVKEVAVEVVGGDGRRLPVLMNAVSHLDQESGERRIDIIVVDATERRRYESELLRERQLAERAVLRLGTLYDVVAGLSGIVTVEDVVRVVSEHSSRTFTDAACSVWLFESSMAAATRAGDAEVPMRSLTFDQEAPALVTLAQGEVLIVNDSHSPTHRYPLIDEWLRAAGRRSAVIAPLIAEGSLIGVLSYGFDVVREVDEDDRQMVLALAAQTNYALQRARSFESEMRSRKRLERLLRFSSLLSGAVSIEEVCEIIEVECASVLNAGVRVLVLDADSRTVSSLGRATTSVPLSSRSIGCEVVRTGELVISEDSDELRRRFPESPLLAEARCGRVIGVPLVDDRVVTGALVFDFEDSGPPDDDDVTLVRLFAEQIDQAIRRAGLHENESAARQRADQLLAMSSAVNAAITTSDVARAVAERGRRAFDATWLAVYALDPDDAGSYRLFAHGGVDAASSEAPPDLARDDEVIAELASTLAPLYAEGRPPVFPDCRAFSRLPWSSLAFVPLSMSGDLVGLVAVGFRDSTELTPAVRVALAGLTAEASSALGRARRYELQHEVAVTLQKSLRADAVPSCDGWRISADYRPGTDHLIVGGDFFDISALDDGRLVVVVGDVVGHGLEAAAAMGQLRSASRALAISTDGPLELLRGLERFARVTPGVRHASLVCCAITSDGEGAYASAGHPFPALIGAAGQSELLIGGRSSLLGLGNDPRSEATFSMPPGSRLVVYTDGLIERRGEDLDDGFQRLLQYLEGNGGQVDRDAATRIIDALLGDTDHRDDAVVVAIDRLE